MKLDVTSLRAPHRGRLPRRPPAPAALKEAAAAHAAKHPNDLEDLGYTGVSFLEKGSLKSVQEYAASLQDAGNAIPVAKNASLYQLGFSYHAARRREAWVLDAPKNGVLEMQVVITPSWHRSDVRTPEAPAEDAPAAAWDAYETQYDAYEKSCEKYATEFALTNRYHVEVHYPDGHVDRQTFAVNGKEPEWASASPTMKIDLAHNKGDIVIKGWAEGSAGADAYASARVTVLHNP